MIQATLFSIFSNTVLIISLLYVGSQFLIDFEFQIW